MVEVILLFIEEFRGAFRVVDAVDIVLVSAFIYAMMIWFQRTTSRGVFIGVGAMTVIYLIARGLDMYLTSLAFHTLFAVLLFGLVVVFQEDLRRFLERLSNLRSIRLHQNQETRFDYDGLVETVFKMAATKTGALIVFKATEPLTRHLHGGIKLDGFLSQSLVASIFDSSTPGHDGAVVIEGAKVSQFASHLPLSVNDEVIAGRGTRHSAALGLAERSDALTVVVSEERGVVSVAESGNLIGMDTAASLKQRLDEFQTKLHPVSNVPLWHRILVHHGRAKVISLLIATLAWFAVAYDPNTLQRTFVFPIEYRNLAKQLELEPRAPTECRVTLSGSDRHFRFLDPANVKVTLDLTDMAAGYHEFAISEKNMRLPANLNPYRIEPRTIRLQLRTQILSSTSVQKTVP